LSAKENNNEKYDHSLAKENLARRTEEVRMLQGQIADMRVTGSEKTKKMFDLEEALKDCKRVIKEDVFQIRTLCDDLQEAHSRIEVLKSILLKRDKSVAFKLDDRVKLEAYLEKLKQEQRQADKARRRKAWAEKKAGPKDSNLMQEMETAANTINSLLADHADAVRTMRPRNRGKGLESVLPGANSVNGLNSK
jgi:chromosome segregation ATPase